MTRGVLFGWFYGFFWVGFYYYYYYKKNKLNAILVPALLAEAVSTPRNAS